MTKLTTKLQALEATLWLVRDPHGQVGLLRQLWAELVRTKRVQVDARLN